MHAFLFHRSGWSNSRVGLIFTPLLAWSLACSVGADEGSGSSGESSGSASSGSNMGSASEGESDGTSGSDVTSGGVSQSTGGETSEGGTTNSGATDSNAVTDSTNSESATGTQSSDAEGGSDSASTSDSGMASESESGSTDDSATQTEAGSGAESDSAESDVTGSEATESDTTESDATESDSTESDTAESDVTGSDTTESDTTESDTTESETTESDSGMESSDDSDTGADVGEVVAHVQLIHSGSALGKFVPVTFGQPFAPGRVSGNTALLARTVGGHEEYPLQIDARTLHDDKTLRHAVLSLVVPEIPGSATLDLEIVTAPQGPEGDPVSLDELIDADPDVELRIDSAAGTYVARLGDVIQTPTRTWRSGPVVGEWIFIAPVRLEGGTEHAHLRAAFHVAKYAGQQALRVDVVLEQGWTFVEGPSDLRYDLDIRVDGGSVITFDDLSHFHHSRWRERIWTGDVATLHIGHDARELIDSHAIPVYDPALIGAIDTSSLADLDFDAKVGVADGFTGTFAPMGRGLALAEMHTTGGRRDIGPQPSWHAMYLLMQDPRTRRVMLEMGDSAGSWPIHWRDANTGDLVRLTDHPELSTHSNSPLKPAACVGACNTPYQPDDAHQPSMAYVPYLVTGDYYYLEELMFWANYNVLKIPAGEGYRDGDKGHLYGQLRGIAWSLRTLAHAAYITPDDDPRKGYFETLVANNVENLESRYLEPLVNEYGALRPYGDVNLSGWQDDFFTWTVGRLVEMGFESARELARWKSRFSVQRMGLGVEGNEWCWIFAAPYQFRNVLVDGSFVADMNTLWRDNYADYQDLECASEAFQNQAGLRPGEMAGYGDLPAGYPAIMGAALATSVDLELTDAAAAWATFDAREVRPDMSGYPNWALVPRRLLP